MNHELRKNENGIQSIMNRPEIMNHLKGLIEELSFLSDNMIQDCYDDEDINFNSGYQDERYNQITDRVIEKLSDIMEEYIK